MHKKTINGKYFKIDLQIKKFIKANYHKIKDWKMDPKGYFLIKIDRKKKLLNVGYCKVTKKSANKMISVVYGKTAIEIINTLIKQKYLSTLQHAGDMGIELCKAEIALKKNLNYIQDKDLIFSEDKKLKIE